MGTAAAVLDMVGVEGVVVLCGIKKKWKCNKTEMNCGDLARKFM